MARLEKFPTHILIKLEPQDQKLEIGRQTKEEPPPLAIIANPVFTRLVIATKEETIIGRDQLRIEVIDTAHVRLTNINDNNRISLPGDAALRPGESTEVVLPTRLIRGNVQINIEMTGSPDATSQSDEQDDEFESMASPPMTPNSPIIREFSTSTTFNEDSSILHCIPQLNSRAILERLEKLILVLQHAASSTDFVDEIAKTTVQMVNLDRCAVMTLERGSWKIVGVLTHLETDPTSGIPARNC